MRERSKNCSEMIDVPLLTAAVTAWQSGNQVANVSSGWCVMLHYASIESLYSMLSKDSTRWGRRKTHVWVLARLLAKRAKQSRMDCSSILFGQDAQAMMTIGGDSWKVVSSGDEKMRLRFVLASA
jgi:hypothetical protein